ncbi:MAG: hypothetical protein H6735_26880 [Alphaproteobacteria bacterium]|nr:hypothetical protein [Alphaproteobacteria bacterium]
MWLVALAHVAWAVEFSVAPVQSELVVAPGSTVTHTLQVQNQGDQVLSVRTYVWDWWYDGPSHRFEPPGTFERSAAGWFTVFPQEVQLNPGEVAKVQLNGSIPNDIEAGWFAVAFVEAHPVQEDPAGGMQLLPGGRIGSLLMLRAGRTGTRTLEAGTPRVTSVSGAPLDAFFDLTDKGDVHTFVELRAVLRDAKGGVVDRLDVRGMRLLPGQTRPLEAKGTTPLAAGDYELVGSFVYGDDQVLPVRTVLHLGADAPR